MARLSSGMCWRAEEGCHGGVLVREQRALHDLNVLLLDEGAGLGQRHRRVAAGVGEVRDDADGR